MKVGDCHVYLRLFEVGNSAKGVLPDTSIHEDWDDQLAGVLEEVPHMNVQCIVEKDGEHLVCIQQAIVRVPEWLEWAKDQFAHSFPGQQYIRPEDRQALSPLQEQVNILHNELMKEREETTRLKLVIAERLTTLEERMASAKTDETPSPSASDQKKPTKKAASKKKAAAKKEG
jgi:hypothetical protein